MTDAVKVRITARATISFCKEFEMPKQDYEQYLECLDRCQQEGYNHEAEREIDQIGESWLNLPEDVLDVDEFEDIEITPLDDLGKPIRSQNAPESPGK